ncbi:MAG TPA: DUF58 domain-containing protein [Rectinemataceae bacterium]|nr:DUF58 domain-containing protein [Rectinemataceae bacterium]
MSSSAPIPEALLRRLEWTVLRRLDGLLQGDYRSLFRGLGMDLAEIREYQYGDDVRFMDWNVTARLGSPYVRRFDEDRDLTAWFVLDLSASVHFGSGQATKLELLAGFTGTIARLLSGKGNRVGALIFDGRDQELVSPKGGRLHLLYLLDRILSRPPIGPSPPTDLRAPLMAAVDLAKRRSLVFVVSDFFSPPGWAEPLSYLARRHELVAVRLIDPTETELPDLGIVTLQDSETGEQIQVNSHSRALRARFAEASARREEALRAAFDRANVDVLELSTRDDLALAILGFAELRKRRSQLAGAATVTRRAAS